MTKTQANETIKTVAKRFAAMLSELMSENTPFPEIRKAWLDHTKPIAAKYSAGLITKKQMKELYRKEKELLVDFVFCDMLRNYPNEGIREAIITLMK